MWTSPTLISTMLLLLAALFTGTNGSAQLYEFGPPLDESLDPANELYAEVSLVDPVRYLGAENSILYVSAMQGCISLRWGSIKLTRLAAG